MRWRTARAELTIEPGQLWPVGRLPGPLGAGDGAPGTTGGAATGTTAAGRVSGSAGGSVDAPISTTVPLAATAVRPPAGKVSEPGEIPEVSITSRQAGPNSSGGRANSKSSSCALNSNRKESSTIG